MIEIDKKDEKILFYLLQDSRQSYKSIAKKIGGSKEFVAYRINRLVKNDVITHFSIILNFERLGYMLMQTHYKFINITPVKKEEIIRFLVSNKYSLSVSLCEGNFDLQVYFYIGKPTDFERLIEEFKENFSSHLHFKLSRFPIRMEFYDYAFLIGDNKKKYPVINWAWGQKPLIIDNLDFGILKELAKNCRMPLTDIANSLNSTVSTINNRIRKMDTASLISQYTISVDWAKLGYHRVNLQVTLKDYSKKNDVITFVRGNPNLIRQVKYLDMDMKLHFTFLLKKREHIWDIIDSLSSQLASCIYDYQFYSTYKVYKNNFLIPELIHGQNPLTR